MAADSTELTFIRCSSCRSLVPAMSTRCRMCGTDLEQKKAAAPEAVHSQPVEPAKPVVAAKELDPLNEFLSDVSEPDDFDDVDISEGLAASEVEDSSEEFSELESSTVDEVDEFDDFDEEQAIRELDSLLEELNATTKKPLEKPVVAKPIEEPKLFAKPVEEKLVAKPIEEPKLVALKEKEPEIRRVVPTKPAPAVVEPVMKAKVAPAPVVIPELIHKEKEMEKEMKVVENKVSPLKSAPIKQVAGKTAPLFGWLVSYQNAEGVSQEIREGKFFVTGASLKPNDLIIEDESVSTPHAMITISHELGFQIQDLMSDQGLYIKKHGSKKYETIDDIEVIENGDWIRFGNVEYLVVIMPA